jgi:hypothetical protein
MLKYTFDRAIIWRKKIIYRGSGERIQYGGRKLYFIPGTRPVKLKYINDMDIVVRNEALQIKFFLDNVKAGDFCIDVGDIWASSQYCYPHWYLPLAGLLLSSQMPSPELFWKRISC